MMIHIANPIYDAVFKYLMEDERVARTILSALLKKDVISVELRRNEYANVARTDISMFRIDFGALVCEPDGHEHLVLIELQKTWLPTETLRFRQYLGAQYANKENMIEEKFSPSRFAIPMVAVYLLGQKVGNITEPVLYVRHKAYNYDGHEVTQGLPDPFVESLIHDSIIVQIPLLHGRVNNRLDRVLSLFDQSLTDKDNPRLICLDEAQYAEDGELQHILHRLTAASADVKVRRDMEVEDEFLTLVEGYDTTIMRQKQQLEQANSKLQAQQQKLHTTAKLLRDSGLSPQSIAEATGLSLEEIALL